MAELAGAADSRDMLNLPRFSGIAAVRDLVEKPDGHRLAWWPEMTCCNAQFNAHRADGGRGGSTHTQRTGLR